MPKSCSRCGGSGTYQWYTPSGHKAAGTCFKCHGYGTGKEYQVVFDAGVSPAEQTKILRQEEERRIKAVQKKQEKEEKERLAYIEAREKRYKKLVMSLPKASRDLLFYAEQEPRKHAVLVKEYIFPQGIPNILSRIESLSMQSTGAIAAEDRKALSKGARELKAALKKRAEREPVPSGGGRMWFEGTVLNFYTQDSYYGSNRKMIFEDDRGFKLFGAPVKLGTDKQGWAIEGQKGDKIRFMATVDTARDDRYKGYYKRPTKGELIKKARKNPRRNRRPIPLDKDELMRTAKGLVHSLRIRLKKDMREGYSGAINPEPDCYALVNRRLEIVNVRGVKEIVEIVLCFSTNTQGGQAHGDNISQWAKIAPPYVIGAGYGHIPKNVDHWAEAQVALYFSGWTGYDQMLRAVEYPELKPLLIDKIYSELIHEFTHAKDVMPRGKRHKQEMKKKWGSRRHEMRAVMQQVIDEVFSNLTPAKKKMFQRVNFEQVVQSLSPKYKKHTVGKKIRVRLSSETKADILSAVHQALVESGMKFKRKRIMTFKNPNDRSGPINPWIRRGQPGSEIQALLFDREHFNGHDARRWIKEHEFIAPKCHPTKNYLRYRQADPGDFKKDSFRTVALVEGIKAIVAIPKLRRNPSYPTELVSPSRIRLVGFSAPKIRAIKPHMMPAFKEIEALAGKRLKFPSPVYAMSKAEIREGANIIDKGHPNGAGHGIFYPASRLIKVNANMSPEDIWVNVIHENLHYTFPMATEIDIDKMVGHITKKILGYSTLGDMPV